MSFIGDFQPSRGAAFEFSPTFKRRERRRLDLPVAERRLSAKVGERSLRMTKATALFVTQNLLSTVAPRLGWIIALSPALKRRARLKCRSAAGRPSFQKLVNSDKAIMKAETLYCQRCRNAELKWRNKSILAKGLASMR